MSDEYIIYDPAEFDKIEIKPVENSDEITRLRDELAAVTAERDALAARLAPVGDEELVEIVAKVLQAGDELEWSVLPEEWKKDWLRDARVAIAAIRPHIEAVERERCAKAGKAALLKSNYGELHADANYADELGEEIAAAIRSGKA